MTDPTKQPTEGTLSSAVEQPAPEPTTIALAIPSAQSGEKSGDVEGAHVDTLLQTQMGGLTFTSSLLSPPISTPPSSHRQYVVEPPIDALPNFKVRADGLVTGTAMDVTTEENREVFGKRKATSSPPSAHKAGGFVTLECAEIPEYLHGGEFFRSLNADPDDAVLVPENRYRPNDTVETIEDLQQAFHVMMFWVLTKFPRGVLHFCHHHDISMWENVAAQLFNPADKLLADLLAIFEDGKSPLVRAISLGRVEAVDYLVGIKYAHQSLAPCVAAASVGQLSFLKLLHGSGYVWSKETAVAAATGGHVECLMYLHEHGCPWDESTFIAAAREGHVECMKFALDHGLNQWSAEVCSAAAEGGHLGCLKFAREKGCPWDDNVTLKATENAPVLATSINPADPEETRKLEEQRRALEAGRFECLQFALLHNCPIHKDACTNAAAGGHLPTLQLLHDRAPPAPWNADTILAAVEAGSLECLTYLHRNRCPWDTRAPEAAAKRGDIACLRYCIGNWCPYDADLMRQAAASPVNSLACLKFLIGEQGMYMNDDGSVFGAVLLRGDVECARYLINFDCPFRSFKYQKGQTWTIVDTATFDDKLSQTITLAYRFGWRWNDAFEAYVKATTTPPLTKCCALIDGRGPPTAVPARTVPTAGGLPWPPSFKPGFSFF